MTFSPEAFLTRYLEQDALLASQPNAYPTSPWWLEQIGRIVRDASTKRRFVGRVGRRGGKSSTMCRLAVCWALHGPHRITPGDVGVVAIVSVDRTEASQRLRLLATILTTLGVTHEQRGDTIALTDQPIEFRVHTCSVSGVVGFTSILVLCDEMAHWESRDGYADPARDVIGQLMPTMATQRYGFAAMISTPWGFDDMHAEFFDRGNTDDQNIAHAESWVANPSLTEEDTRRDEPDQKEWLRQYGAEPSQNVSAAFDHEALQRALTTHAIGEGRLFCAIDMAKPRADGRTKRDHHSMAIGHVSAQSLSIVDCWEYPHSMHVNEVVDHIAGECRKHGIHEVWSDAFESQVTLFEKKGLASVMRPYTAQLKIAAVAAFRRMLGEGKVSLREQPDLVDQLSQVRERLAPNGSLHYPNTNGLDIACAAVLTPLMIVSADPQKYASGYQVGDYAKMVANMRSWGWIHRPGCPCDLCMGNGGLGGGGLLGGLGGGGWQ